MSNPEQNNQDKIAPKPDKESGAENNQAQKLGAILGYEIIADKNSRLKITLDRDNNKVIINPELFRNAEQAKFSATTMAMRQAELLDIIRTYDKEDIKTMSESDPKIVSDLALWSAARRMAESEKQKLEEILTNLPPADSFIAETKNACLKYIATGSFGLMSTELKELFDKLPQNKATSRNPLDSLADSAVSIERKLNYYQRFIAPILELAKALDRQIETTISKSFKPSTENNEGEPLDEKAILQRVYPFFGGYYREEVFDGVDWQNIKVIATSQISQTLDGVELDEEQEIKQYEFKGTNGQKIQIGSISLPLPAGVQIIQDTLTPGFVIKRDSKGIYLLSLDERLKFVNSPQEYQFKFIVKSDIPDFMQYPPTKEESIFSDTLEIFTQEKISQLEELSKLNLSPSNLAKRITAQIHQEFDYINSDEVGQALGLAGANYFKQLEEIKKADCDVANFYLIAQLRSLGISARMVTGYYVTDKSFGFAPIAGTKHAWTEYFDNSAGIWRRIDATPPKKDDEDKNKDKEKKNGGSGGEEMLEQAEDAETSFEGDIENESLDLSSEQLEKFNEFLQAKLAELSENDQIIDERKKQAFLKEYGIKPEEWEKVIKYIDQVNQTKIPKENTVDKIKDSILGEEWKKFFKLFLVAYRIPDKTRVMSVRQSLGDDLVDPSTTVIDLLYGSDDPYGFEKIKKGEQEIKLPIDFSNDFLLDLTASMDTNDNFGQSLKEYQKQFVMSALYHGFEINQKLKYYAGELTELPFISNHLLSIHGKHQYKELTAGNKEITMTQLAELYKLLDQTEQGAGDMVSALELYKKTLISDQEIFDKIKEGKMIKTLTIISDGNLWCSRCGKESCTVFLHAESAAKSKKIVQELRNFGVIVNAIGFTENSQPIVEIFDNQSDPGAAIVASDTQEAIVMYHKQMIKSWQAIKKAADFRQVNKI